MTEGKKRHKNEKHDIRVAAGSDQVVRRDGVLVFRMSNSPAARSVQPVAIGATAEVSKAPEPSMRGLGPCGEQAGRNASERRACLESTNVDAAPATWWGSPQPLASNETPGIRRPVSGLGRRNREIFQENLSADPKSRRSLYRAEYDPEKGDGGWKRAAWISRRPERWTSGQRDRTIRHFIAFLNEGETVQDEDDPCGTPATTLEGTRGHGRILLDRRIPVWARVPPGETTNWV